MLLSIIYIIKVEFAVQINSKSGADVLKSTLKELSGVDNVNLFPESGILVVKSSLPISVLQEKIESVGHKVVIKGYGGIEQGDLYYVSLYHKRIFYCCK